MIVGWSVVAAILAMFAWMFVMWSVFGVLLIYAAFLVVRMYLDDPAPGLRAVQMIGLALTAGGIGTLITGHAVWVVIQLSRSGLGWLRAKRADKGKRGIR